MVDEGACNCILRCSKQALHNTYSGILVAPGSLLPKDPRAAIPEPGTSCPVSLEVRCVQSVTSLGLSGRRREVIWDVTYC